jgi:hypothetical protein
MEASTCAMRFLNFGSREILVPVVDCFKLASIDSDNRLSKQV